MRMINRTLLISILVFLNCSTAIIKDTITHRDNVWDISVLKINTGIDKIHTDGTSVISKNSKDKNSPVKEIHDYSSSAGNTGFNNQYMKSSSGSKAFKNQFMNSSSEVKTGSDISTTLSFESTVTPSSPFDDFIEIEISVRNVSGSIQGFDFERVRLLFDDSVSRPYVLLTPEIIAINRSFYYTLKPDNKITRKLIFVHKKGSLPYRVVYDSIKNGNIVDKLSFQVNAVKP